MLAKEQRLEIVKNAKLEVAKKLRRSIGQIDAGLGPVAGPVIDEIFNLIEKSEEKKI